MNNKYLKYTAVVATIIAVLHVITLVRLNANHQTTNALIHSKLTAPSQSEPNLETIRATIQAALPSTPIRSVMPAPIDGLYEVTSENGLMYTDVTGRYLFVGGIYDPKTNTDLVKARKQELGFTEPDPARSASASTAPSKTQTQSRTRQLPVDSVQALEQWAITYREIDGAPIVYELFDPMCGYCRKNHDELMALPVTIKKVLVKNVGSKEINQQVYCAKDPKAVIDSLMTRNQIVTDGQMRPGCDVADLDKIEQWVRDNRLPGPTPQIIFAPTNTWYLGYVERDTWANRFHIEQ